MTAVGTPYPGCWAFPRSGLDAPFSILEVLQVEGDLVRLRQLPSGGQLLAPVSEYSYHTPPDLYLNDLEQQVRHDAKQIMTDAYGRLALYVIVGVVAGVGVAMALFSYFGGAS